MSSDERLLDWFAKHHDLKIGGKEIGLPAWKVETTVMGRDVTLLRRLDVFAGSWRISEMIEGEREGGGPAYFHATHIAACIVRDWLTAALAKRLVHIMPESHARYVDYGVVRLGNNGVKARLWNTGLFVGNSTVMMDRGPTWFVDPDAALIAACEALAEETTDAD